MENALSHVVDALPGMVWTALPDGHVDFLNQRWCEYTGLSVDEAYGRGWQTAIHPDGLPVSRFIIESHHGRLWAAPNDGPGATFSFSIPRRRKGVMNAHSSVAVRTPAVIDSAHVMRTS